MKKLEGDEGYEDEGLRCIQGTIIACIFGAAMWALLIFGILECCKGCKESPKFGSLGSFPTNVTIKAEVIK